MPAHTPAEVAKNRRVRKGLATGTARVAFPNPNQSKPLVDMTPAERKALLDKSIAAISSRPQKTRRPAVVARPRR